MEKYEVKITDEALSDMERIFQYIAYGLSAPENAMGQYNRIADAVLKLDTYPERFAIFEMEPEHSWGMRRMAVDNYLVCYLVEPGIVTVTDVIYGAANVHERLKGRHN